MITKTSVLTTATLIAAANPRRQWMAIPNHSDVTIYIATTEDASEVTGPAGLKPGIPIVAGDTLSIGQPSTDTTISISLTRAVYAIHTDAGEKVVSVHEGV